VNWPLVAQPRFCWAVYIYHLAFAPDIGDSLPLVVSARASSRCNARSSGKVAFAVDQTNPVVGPSPKPVGPVSFQVRWFVPALWLHPPFPQALWFPLSLLALLSVLLALWFGLPFKPGGSSVLPSLVVIPWFICVVLSKPCAPGPHPAPSLKLLATSCSAPGPPGQHQSLVAPPLLSAPRDPCIHPCMRSQGLLLLAAAVTSGR
jgi:hypothetical protein